MFKCTEMGGKTLVLGCLFITLAKSGHCTLDVGEKQDEDQKEKKKKNWRMSWAKLSIVYYMIYTGRRF